MSATAEIMYLALQLCAGVPEGPAYAGCTAAIEHRAEAKLPITDEFVTQARGGRRFGGPAVTVLRGGANDDR